MKKLLCFTLAAVLAAALAAPAFAEDATVNQNNTVTQNSTEKTASTTVQFKIDSTYIVTIPATVELGKVTAQDGTVTYEKDLTVTASNVRLNEKKELKVSLESDYKLSVNSTVLTYKLPYTVTAKQGDANEKSVTDDSEDSKECARFVTDTNEQTVTLHFAADNPTYAGDYSDTVTFNLAVVDPTQTATGGTE